MEKRAGPAPPVIAGPLLTPTVFSASIAVSISASIAAPGCRFAE